MGFAAGNAQHIGARPQQQDAFGFSDPSDRTFVIHGGFLGVVADGVGGLTHGSEASQSAVRTFLQAYHLKSPGESIPDALARSLSEANSAVLRVASAAEGAGTTLVAAVLHSQSLCWISAGDSRIYLLHGNRLTRVTSDHVYARQLDEQAAQGLISRDEAQNHSERGSLTSYLGQSEPKEVDRSMHPLALQPDDCVILCSDGFYRALDELEIVGAFRGDLQRGCDTLVGQVLAKRRKQQDNLTVIALKHSPRNGKWGSARRSGTRSRLPLLAAVVLIMALLSAGAGYWYEKHSADTKQVPPSPAPVPTTNADDSAAGNGTNIKPIENPPPIDKKSQAATKSAKPLRRRRQKPKPKAPNSTAPENAGSGSSQSGPSQKNSGSAQEKTPGRDQSALGEGTVPSSTGKPTDVEAAPPASAAGADGKSSSPQAPAGNQEKQQPPPAQVPDSQPNSPPNLAFGTTNCSILPLSYAYIFRARELSWALGMKDGEPSCHS